MSAERRVILGFAAGGVTLLFGSKTPEGFLPPGERPLTDSDLATAAVAAQQSHSAPVIVIPGEFATIEAVLDNAQIRSACLLLLQTGESATRRALEALPWRQWPRVGLVDLEYCPPRVLEDTPGVQRLSGGLGLVTLGMDWPVKSSFVPIARLLPELRSPAMPPRVAALELEAARASELECRGELARADELIQSLQSSASWRLTSPLRKAKAALHRQGST